MDLKQESVLVTGGASFIGSHLVDALVELGADVHVVDDLSSGSLENIRSHLNDGAVKFVEADLAEPGVARQVLQGKTVVFHLAADHGGRGYVDLHQAGPASNLLMDGLIFKEALSAGVKKVVYASSGCVYPNSYQGSSVAEGLVKPPYDADNMYGWAKLMGELTLQAYHREYGLRSVSCRYFTAYGPRGRENHAIIAMIARAFIGQTPFEVWGDGTQIRNWTYVDDVVRGTLLAAQELESGEAINIGSAESIRVMDAARMVMEETGHQAPIAFLPDMPVGPAIRVADNSLARKTLGWEPEVSFREGLKETIRWYYATKSVESVRADFSRLLTER